MIKAINRKRLDNKDTIGPQPPSAAAPPLDFNSIYHRYAAYVAGVALRLTGDPASVDDIVQEVFLDCFKGIDALSDMAHARRWLVKVTVRKSRRRLQRRKLLHRLAPASPNIEDIAMPGISADDRAAMVQLFRILDKAPVNHRLAWSLRYLEGAGLSETAAFCGCSDGYNRSSIGSQGECHDRQSTPKLAHTGSKPLAGVDHGTGVFREESDYRQLPATASQSKTGRGRGGSRPGCGRGRMVGPSPIR